MLISRKIVLLVVLAMLTCAAVASFGLYGLQLVNANLDETANRSVPGTLFVSDLRTSYLAVMPEAYLLAGVTDPEKAVELEKKISKGTDALMMTINPYVSQVDNDDEKKALHDVKVGLISFTAQIHEVALLATAGKTKEAQEMIQKDVEPIHQNLKTAFDSLVKIHTDRIKGLSTSSAAAFTRTLGVTIAASVIGVLIIGVMGFLLGRSIIKPLGAMQRAITRTATELDFTDSIAVRSRDEIGRTLRAYNELLARLRTSFSDIQAASERLSSSTEEVDQTAKEIAENSFSQSEASSGMAAAVEELTVSISMVAAQAKDASLNTQDSRDKAEHGGEVILSTVSGIKTISESVREASSRIDALRKDSDSISSVANIIKEIADQTNLLALNAAIEAARAGEQGRGFAVVADEVRKLAERTGKSTQEISSLLAQMQGSAKQAVETMAAAVREVDAGVESARLAGESIESIKEGSSTVVNAVREITEAVREQSVASASISQRIEQIAQMTDRNTAAAKSTAEAVHRMSGMSREIADTLRAYKV